VPKDLALPFKLPGGINLPAALSLHPDQYPVMFPFGERPR